MSSQVNGASESALQHLLAKYEARLSILENRVEALEMNDPMVIKDLYKNLIGDSFDDEDKTSNVAVSPEDVANNPFFSNENARDLAQVSPSLQETITPEKSETSNMFTVTVTPSVNHISYSKSDILAICSKPGNETSDPSPLPPAAAVVPTNRSMDEGDEEGWQCVETNKRRPVVIVNKTQNLAATLATVGQQPSGTLPTHWRRGDQHPPAFNPTPKKSDKNGNYSSNNNTRKKSFQDVLASSRLKQPPPPSAATLTATVAFTNASGGGDRSTASRKVQWVSRNNHSGNSNKKGQQQQLNYQQPSYQHDQYQGGEDHEVVVEPQVTTVPLFSSSSSSMETTTFPAKENGNNKKIMKYGLMVECPEGEENTPY